MIECAVVEERWGKANPSFWGQSSWEGGEKYSGLHEKKRYHVIFITT
jgi:hypothetical protein